MKTVLLTGAGKGIGLALAEKFLNEGFEVMGTVRDTESPAPLSPRENLSIFKMDLSETASIEACIADIGRKLEGKKIDILINNAGALFDEDDIKLDPDKLRKTLEVNLIGTADLTERLVPNMAEHSHIVFISSSAGSLSDMDEVSTSHFPYHYPAYKISKCALNMYMRTLASRLSHEGAGVTVSAVHPGWVRTEMGGDEAPVAPEDAAKEIFALAVSRPETGQFWFNGKKHPW